MTRTIKMTLAVIAVLLCITAYVILEKPFSLSPSASTGDYTIKNGHVSGTLGTLGGLDYEVILDADIYADEKALLSVGRGRKIEFIPNRIGILENFFGSIEGITGGDDYLIQSIEDLEEFVRLCQSEPMYQDFDIVPEDTAFFERYSKEGKVLLIVHRENEFSYYIRENSSPLERIKLAKTFAQALGVESYFDYDNPISTQQGINIPVRIDGLPILAVSRDVLLDKEAELYVLQYLGADHLIPGIGVEFYPDDTFIKCWRTVLPLEISSEKEPVITVAEAIEALNNTLDSIYIDGKFPRVTEDEDLIITEITLAYGAVYAGDGEYSLEPIYAFTPEEDYVWHKCLMVNAITGDVYPAIDMGYSATGLNKLK